MLAYAGEYIKSSKTIALLFIGYLILLLTLLPIRESGELWESYNGYFHLTALIMMAFISFKNFANYFEAKNPNALIVAFSFSSISLFHVFHLFASVSGWMYVFGHIALLTGFVALLAMATRVKKK